MTKWKINDKTITMRLLTTLLLICSTMFVQAQNIESASVTAATAAVVTENTQQETTVSKSSKNIDIVD